MSVIAKRTVSPSSGPWRDAFTVGELTIAVDLDIKGEKRAMGIKVTITLLNNEKGGTTLAGIRLELEASMQVLIPKDKFSVFTMDFIWTKGTGEFSGECEFSGIGNVLVKGDLLLQYYLDYERWEQFSYLDPSELYMSLRYLNNSFI
ncbi:hypothetical protein ACHAQK_011008 [Fusarium lateritium]